MCFSPVGDHVASGQRYICQCPRFYDGRYCEVDVSTSTAHRVGVIVLLLFTIVAVSLAVCLGIRYKQDK